MKLILTSIAVSCLLAAPAMAQSYNSAPELGGGAPGETVRTAAATRLVYVVNLANGTPEFGTVDLLSGAFHQIGPAAFEGLSGLVPRPNGSFLTLGFSGNLDVIDPFTGAAAIVGPTGLDDCGSPASPCGPTSAANLARLGNTVYATDFSNNLYTVDPVTGASTLVGRTGIPAFTFNPNIPVDGLLYIFDYSLFDSGGHLYEIFDVATVDLATFEVTPLIPANLYRIDPSTAVATFIAPTDLNITAVVDVNGTPYAFNAATNTVGILDLATGITTPATDLDPIVGLVVGAFPVPAEATGKADCKNPDWESVVRADGSWFQNQGACVSYVQRRK